MAEGRLVPYYCSRTKRVLSYSATRPDGERRLFRVEDYGRTWAARAAATKWLKAKLPPLLKKREDVTVLAFVAAFELWQETPTFETFRNMTEKFQAMVEKAGIL